MSTPPRPGEVIFVDKLPSESDLLWANLDRQRAAAQAAADSLIASALETQIGGAHYKQFAIQPVEFITKNNLGFLEGCIIKRVCRYKAKNGVEDLQKIKHEVDLLIELHYGGEKQ